MSTTTHLKAGARVIVKREHNTPPEVLGRVFTVTRTPRADQRRVRCAAEDGGRGLNWTIDGLLPATDENLTRQAQVIEAPLPEFFWRGEIVTLNQPFGEWTTTTPMVVVGQKKYVQLVPLGGANGSGMRISERGITRRDLAWLAAQLNGGES